MSAAGRGRTLAWWAACAGAAAAVVLHHGRAAAPGMAFVGPDLRNFFFAVREATAAALRAGHLPGWQRGIFVGYPLLADPQAAVLDPATWLTLPWDAPRALTLATLLHLCIAAWGMIFWLRERGLGPAEALLGAVLFAVGAKETVHVQHWNFAASTAWWPWMLGGLEAFAARGRGRFLVLTAGAAALSWLGGAAQMAYFGTLVAGAHAAVLAPRLWRRRPADAVLALGAAPLGLLLAGPVVLPVMELAALGPRGAGVSYRFATSWKWPDRWGLSLLVLPNAYGGRWWIAEMNLWEATGYLGILPLGLAAAAPLRRRGTWLFAVLAVLGIWLCFGEDAWLDLHRLAYRFLPGYGAFRNPTRSLMVTSLAAALLAAEALGALREPGAAPRRWLRAAVVLAAVVAVAPALPGLEGFPLDRAAARRDVLPAVLLATAGVAWLAAGAWRIRSAAARATWALVPAALAFADLHLAFGAMNQVGPADAERPALADLAPLVPAAPAPRRVGVVARWGRTANAPLRNGWEGATGYGPTVIQRVRALLLATHTGRVDPPAPVESDINFPGADPTSPLWSLLGTPLVVADAPLPLHEVASVRPEWDLPTSAYQAAALPRVFWCGAWEPADDGALSAPLAAAARGDRAVLAPDGPLGAFASGAPGGPVPAEGVAVDGDRLEATLVAPRDGVAVVLEPWFPGWSATLDGAPAPLARADLAFMAVPVREGRHVLRLEYRPTRLGRGALVAAVALAGLGGALAWRRRGRPAAPDPSASTGSDRA